MSVKKLEDGHRVRHKYTSIDYHYYKDIISYWATSSSLYAPMSNTTSHDYNEYSVLLSLL